MRIKITKYLLLGGASLMILACSKYPKDVLPQKQMVDVLCDIHVLQSIYQNKAQDFNSNQKKNALVNAMLEKHGITQAILDSSLVWYSDRPDLYTKVNDSVVAILKRQQTYYSAELSKNSSNELIIPRYHNLSSTNSIFSFRLDSVMIEKLGGNIVFGFNVLGAINSTVKAQVAFEFSDTTLYVNKTINRNIAYTLEAPEYPQALKRVFGFVRLQPKTAQENILLYKMNISTKSE